MTASQLRDSQFVMQFGITEKGAGKLSFKEARRELILAALLGLQVEEEKCSLFTCLRLFAGQFFDQFFGLVDVFQGVHHGANIYGDGAILRFIKDEIAD